MQTGNAEKPRLGYANGGKIQCMADGGLISKLFGSSEPELTASQKWDIEAAKRAAKAAKNAPAPAAAPAANPAAGSALDPTTALKAREKAAGLAKGGPVEGSGGPTDDQVPIMASDGEFVIKEAAVQKLGVPTLEALNAVADGDAKPKLGKVKRKRRGVKRKFEIGGGIAKDPDEQRRLANQTAMYVQGAQTAAANRPPEPAVTPPAADPAPTPQPGGAVFGLYPQLTGGSQRSTYANDAKLRQGVVATGPSTFQPALPPTPAPPMVGGGDGRRMTGVSPATTPAPSGFVTPAQAQAAPSDPAPAAPVPTATQPFAVDPRSLTNPTAPAGFVTPSQVVRTGNSYTGAPNISGDIQIVDKGGAPRIMRGGLSTVPGYGGGAAASGGGAGPMGGGSQALFEASKAAILRGDTASVAANYGGNFGHKVDPIDALINNGQPMTARKAAAIAQLQAAKAQADGSTSDRALNAAKFGLDKESADLTNRERKTLLTAKDALVNAKPNSAEYLAALDKVQGLTSHTPKELPNRYTPFLRPDQVAPDGMTVMKGGQGVLDNQTGQEVNMQPQANALPPGLKVGASTKQADGTYTAAGKTVVIKGGKVTEIK